MHATGGVIPLVTLDQQSCCPAVGLHGEVEQGGSLGSAKGQAELSWQLSGDRGGCKFRVFRCCDGTWQRSPQERYWAAKVMGVFSSTSLPAADLSGPLSGPGQVFLVSICSPF